MKKIIRLTESDLIKVVNRVLNEQSSSSWDELINLVKKKGVDAFRFKGFLEGIKSQGIELQVPNQQNIQMWILPNGTYKIYKNNIVTSKGTWKLEGGKLIMT